MSAIMNLPQWFMEREDSDLLFFQLYKNNANIVNFSEALNQYNFIFCYYDWSEYFIGGKDKRLFIQGFNNIDDLQDHKLISVSPVFLYNKQTDEFMEIKLEAN